MAIALKDLVKDLVAADVLEDLRTVGGLLGISQYAMQTGKPAGAVMSVFANQFSKLWNANVAPWMRAKFLDYATGHWLTFRAWTDYKRYRTAETFATGTIVVENRGGGFYTVTPGVIRAKNATGKTFTNTTGGTLTPWLGGDYPTLSMVFQADAAGASSNTAAGGIAAFPTPLVQGYANVYARTNASALLGSDAEKDPSLVNRCRISTGPLSPGGPKRAYESVALDVRRNAAGDPVMPEPLGDEVPYAAATPLAITRVKVLELGNNRVRVLLASAAGPAAGSTGTPGTDLFIANVALQLWACPAGMTLETAAAIELPVAIGVITLYVDRASLVTKEEAEADALAALEEFFRTFPIGGKRKVPGDTLGRLYKGEFEGVAKASNRGIFEVDANGFAIDEVFAADRVVVPSYTVNAVLVTQ
ncbi:MAG: baseplate J/gp47 family protein [Byssovorax sp.]